MAEFHSPAQGPAIVHVGSLSPLKRTAVINVNCKTCAFSLTSQNVCCEKGLPNKMSCHDALKWYDLLLGPCFVST